MNSCRCALHLKGVLHPDSCVLLLPLLAAPPVLCVVSCVTQQGYGNQRFVFQGVHETICYGPSDKPWGENEPRINQIVFIGRKLDRKALMEGFR